MTTRFRPSVRYLLFAALVIVFSASSLRAENIRGKFTLPFQTYWGGAVLAPGEYTFQLDTTGERPLVLYSASRSMYVKVGYTDILSSPDKSQLLVVHIGQKPTVHILYLADIKTAFHFNVPAMYEVNTRIVAEASAPALIERIPVSQRKLRRGPHLFVF